MNSRPCVHEVDEQTVYLALRVRSTSQVRSRAIGGDEGQHALSSLGFERTSSASFNMLRTCFSKASKDGQRANDKEILVLRRCKVMDSPMPSNVQATPSSVLQTIRENDSPFSSQCFQGRTRSPTEHEVCFVSGCCFGSSVEGFAVRIFNS